MDKNQLGLLPSGQNHSNMESQNIDFFKDAYEPYPLIVASAILSLLGNIFIFILYKLT
jgi:hypothetical protein